MHNVTCFRAALALGCLVLGGASSLVACGGDDNTATPAKDASVKDTSAGDSHQPTMDTGGGDTSMGGGDAGDAGTTLYQRLGGHAGIRGAVDAVVKAELMNPDMASYFFNQVATPIPAGHPNADQIAECFTDFVGKAAGGPETYPTMVTDDAGTFTCRDMSTIHQPLLISGGTFDKFISIAAMTLAGSVSTPDLQTLGGALIMQKPAIVTGSLADAGLEPFPGDASTKGD